MTSLSGADQTQQLQQAQGQELGKLAQICFMIRDHQTQIDSLESRKKTVLEDLTALGTELQKLQQADQQNPQQQSAPPAESLNGPTNSKSTPPLRAQPVG